MTIHSRRLDGFTLVEIMVVVVIVGVIAGIAIPTFMGIRTNAQAARMVNDFRQYATAFEIHAFELGYWPPDAARATIPATMQGYLRGDGFTRTTPIGGNWDWDQDVFGFWAGISVVDSTAGESVMIKIDEELDDGDLTTGRFRRTASNRYTLVLEEL